MLNILKPSVPCMPLIRTTTLITFTLLLLLQNVTFATSQNQQILQQEQLLRQQNARIERETQRNQLQKERETDQTDLLSSFQETKPENLILKPNPQNCFKLTHITYTSTTLLSKRRQAKLSKQFIGKCITPNLLTSITRNITNYYINKGYVTTRAFINPQNIKTGKLEVTIMEGKLEKIEFDYDVSNQGSPKEEQKNVETGIKAKFRNISSKSQTLTAFSKLEGKILNIRDIEQGLEQLNRLSSNNATMKIMPSKKQGYSKITISKNKKDKNTRVRLSTNNSGQEQTGMYNGKIIVEQDNLLKLTDSIYALYTKNLSKNSNRDSESIYTSINIPFGYWNFSTSYTNSSYLNTINSTNNTIRTTGRSNFANFKVERKVFRNKTSKVGIFTALNLKNTKSFIEDTISDTGSRKLSVASIGLNHSISSQKLGYINYTVAHVFGIKHIKLFGERYFKALRDTGTKDDFTPEAQYKKYTIDINYQKPFQIKNQNLTFQTYISSQYSQDALFSSEQIIIGDQYSVRGFREKSSLGDSGFYIQNNLNYSLPPFLTNKLSINNILNKTEAFIGYDYGYVKQKGGSSASFGEGKGILQGIATGIRFTGKKLQFDITFARTLRTESYIPKGNEVYGNITWRVW